jgi:hypothetical protein
MEMLTEIRRKVLVEGATKRSILCGYKISARVLEKNLAHAEPVGCQNPYGSRSPVVFVNQAAQPVPSVDTARR